MLLVAHANFQDRLLLALGVASETENTQPPLAVHFFAGPPGPRRDPPPPGTAGKSAVVTSLKPTMAPRPGGLDFSDLRAGLENQRNRRARITLPAQEPGQINWGLVCRRYQPEQAAAWSKGAYAFDLEAEQDPVFSQSLFWVVTQSEGCFY